LSDWGARAIIYDILFTEPSTELDDGAFAEAIAQSGRVYLPVALEHAEAGAKWIHNLPEFERHARGIGHINIFPDRDGIMRRVQPFLYSNTEMQPHLALKLAYDVMGEQVPPPGALPHDEHGNFMINWAGPWNATFEHYSYRDILRNFASVSKGEKPLIPTEKFRNKIVFIGLTAAGQTDIKPTPLEPVYPAVGVHANILNSVLTGRYIQPVPMALNQAVMLILGLWTSSMFVRFRSLLFFLANLSLGGIWVWVSYLVFRHFDVWIDTMQPLLLIATLFLFSLAYGFFAEKKEHYRCLQLAIHDGLTGLFVIRYLREVMNDEVLESQVKRRPLSVLLSDVDHFKKINDTYGHQAGDMVLKETAQVMSDLAAKFGNERECPVARYGGEEFLIMARNYRLEEMAFKIAEPLRKAVESHSFIWEGKPIKVTISIGVGTLFPRESVPDPMIGRADAALYRAKDSGRNRVCLGSDAPSKS
ncbi:MAG: CHASE2 domain-containing protein, partial [Candidatus Omnitrophota bacterium]